MQALSHDEIFVMLFALGALLLVARILGEFARRVGQPSVLGEILAGILLGPTLLGAVFPEAHEFLFPTDGGLPAFFEGFTTIAIVLFLLVAGMEVELSTMWRQGKSALMVGVGGIVVPFSMGFGLAGLAPEWLQGGPVGDGVTFALFMGIALSISALPVIAKTMMDLNVYRSDLGMVVIAAAVCNDILGWCAFAVILGMLEVQSDHGFDISMTIVLTLVFAVLVLTVGRSLFHRCLPWVQAHTSWPGGVLGLALSLALLGAAFTQWLGIHAIFGSFLIGIAIGDSSHLREQTRKTIEQFISFIFAPLFFASIGLRVDFAAHFDWSVTLVVLIIATIGKVVGCAVFARWSGSAQREAIAIGFAMNARGAMEIILGLLALQHGLISESLFVALVIMALVTSAISGPAMQWALRLRRAPQLMDFLAAKAFIPQLTARDRWDAIHELVEVAVQSTDLDAHKTERAVRERESLMATGLGDSIAVPHARINGLKRPVVALGLSKDGIDFNAPDGEPAHIVFLILTAPESGADQVSILADIARRFRRPEARQEVFNASNYTELLALLRTTAPA